MRRRSRKSTTAGASAVYVLEAGALTFSLPATWASNGGAVTVADNSGAGGTVAGNVLNWPNGATTMALLPYGSMTFVWSATLNGWLSV